MFTPKKIWTLEEALEVFPRIKRITEDFYEQAYTISKLLSDNIYPENEKQKIGRGNTRTHSYLEFYYARNGNRRQGNLACGLR